MALFAFLLEAGLISLSGVIAPGPITAVAVGKGSDSPQAGALVAIGHGLVEIPLMVAVYLGVGQILSLSYVKGAIALIGGGLLLYMGIGMLRSIKGVEVGLSQANRSPLVAGALLSLGSPYFLIWWATVGAALILRSVELGVLGFVAFAAVHWTCDLAWDSFLSVLSFRGGKFFGKVFQKVVFGVCGAFLVFSSAKLGLDALRTLTGWG